MFSYSITKTVFKIASKTCVAVVKAPYRERFPFSSAGDEGEPLGLNGHPGALDMLLDIPENKNVKIKKF